MLTWSFCHSPAPPHRRFARPRKRLAARGFARARRAVGGIVCEHASALGPASAMRCIAANRHGSPLRGTRNPTEIGLTNGLWLILQATMGLFKIFLSRRKAGFPIRRGEESPARGWGKAPLAGGELVHRPVGGAAPQAVADGSSPSRFPKIARSAQLRTPY